VGLVTLALLMCSCGGSDSGGTSEPVSFLVFGEPVELEAFRDVAEAFERTQPDVDLRLIEASDRDDLLARLSTSFAGGSPPDLFLLNYRVYGQFAAKGVLEPIESRVDDSDAFGAEDFYPQALDAFRFDGTLTCLPQNISSLVVYYNRDLFRKYSIPEPRAGWDWAELRRAAITLTRDDDGDGRNELYGLGVEPSIIRVAPFVWSNGGEVVDDDDRPTRLALDSPPALAVLQEFLALRTQYGAVPTDEEVEAEDDEARFMNGRLAMVLQSRRSTPAFRTIETFDWDVAPLPRFEEPAGILHSDAYCMTKASKHKDAAWRFMEFALGPEGQRITARTGRTVPSLKEVAHSEAFLDPAQKPRNSRVFLDGISSIRRVPTISTWPEIEDTTAGILENGLYLGIPADRVARQLDEATRPLFARAER